MGFREVECWEIALPMAFEAFSECCGLRLRGSRDGGTNLVDTGFLKVAPREV